MQLQLQQQLVRLRSPLLVTVLVRSSGLSVFGSQCKHASRSLRLWSVVCFALEDDIK